MTETLTPPFAPTDPHPLDAPRDVYRRLEQRPEDGRSRAVTTWSSSS